MPSIVTANDLRTGAVLYLAADGSWTPRLTDAAIAGDADALVPLEAEARAAVEARQVTAVYAFPVVVHAGHPEPVSVRETIRAALAFPLPAWREEGSCRRHASGMGEGQTQAAAHVSAPHPNPLPIRKSEWGEGEMPA